MSRLIQAPKQLLKSGLQHIAARFGRHRQSPSQPELLVLMYHRILPADDPRARLEEPGMMVTPESFRMHMQILRELFTPIHLSQWLHLKTTGGSLPDRACAVTFDDGWADNHEYAWPVLQQQEIPATIFLVSEMINSNRHFWPLRLARLVSNLAEKQPSSWQHPALKWLKQAQTDYAFNHQQPDREQLSEIITAAKSLDDNEIHHRLDSIEKQLSLDLPDNQPSLLTWQQVNDMLKSGLVEVGSHTCRHIRLATDKSDSILEQEIIHSRRLIEQNTATTVKTFCYPNGDYSDKAEALVRQNYTGAVTTQSGWNTINSDNFLLKRIGVHEDISNTRTRFLSRLSGWL